MGRRKRDGASGPTEAELEILAVLWACGPSTVRQVHEALSERGTGYTTTLKLMQLMTQKGQLTRNADQRSHVYQAAISKHMTQGRLVDRLIDRAFAGSSAALVVRALSAKAASPQELEEIRRMLDELEDKARR